MYTIIRPLHPDPQLQLARAMLAAHDQAGAEEIFRHLHDRDKKHGDAISRVYLEVAKQLAARSRVAVLEQSVIPRYVGAAGRWSRSDEARTWYYNAAASALPLLEYDERMDAAARIVALEEEKDSINLRRYVAEEIDQSKRRDPARWLALVEAWDGIHDETDAKERADIARNYADIAKRIGADDPESTAWAIRRATELNEVWLADIELLALRAQVADAKTSLDVSAMQRTANTMIQIAKAAAKYMKAHGEYPDCMSVYSFIASVSQYADAELEGTDGWGHSLSCYVQPHRQWFSLDSSGPDGEFGRGKELYVTEAMPISGDEIEEADIHFEAGFFAPPHWTAGQVRALYGR